MDRHLKTLARLVIEIGHGTRKNEQQLQKNEQQLQRLVRTVDRFVGVQARRNGNPGRGR